MQITDEMLYQHAAQAREIWLDALPQKEEIPAFSCSKQFQRKMGRLLRQQRRSPRFNRFLRDMKRIVAVFLIALTITFAGLMTVEATREKIIEVVVHIYHELTRYEYSSDAETAELPEIQFGYLPAGMELVSNELPFGSVRHIHCEDSSGKYIDLDIDAVTQSTALSWVVDTEDAEVMTRIVNGTEVTFISKNSRQIAAWTDQNVSYVMQSNLERPVIDAILENLCIGPYFFIKYCHKTTPRFVTIGRTNEGRWFLL